MPRPARLAPPPPALASPPECSDVWIGDPTDPYVAELVDSLVPLVDEGWPAQDSIDADLARSEQPAVGESFEAAHRPPDPLADDGPLSNFLEGAIHYYGSASDLHEALASIEMGPIEDLDASMSLPEDEPSGDDLDETHPSGRFRRRRASSEIAT
jgi:hypothetical protein